MESALSHNFFSDLYETKNTRHEQPVLQILGFEQSETDFKEITVRLSDGRSYVDCSLVGPYTISGDRIRTSEHARSQQSFKKYDVIRVTDYFFKIDQRRINRLVIVVRKITNQKSAQQKTGMPEQVSEYVSNHFQNRQSLENQNEGQMNHRNGSNPHSNHIKVEGEGQDSRNGFNIHNISNVQHGQNARTDNSFQQSNLGAQKKQRQQRNQEQPLTLRDIMNNQKGFLIGRLVRLKFTVKQTAKDKPLSLLYLGFLDLNGDLVRTTLAGGYAMKERHELKVGKCYYISELEYFQTNKMNLPSIKLKEKETKISQVTTSKMVNRFDMEYFHWQHDFEQVEAQFVDVIGVVDRFEEKASYPQTNTTENRQVIRVVIRNHLKTIRISFWAEQIKNLDALKLKRGQAIVLLDVRKKKKLYLDFTFQSDVIKLSDRPDLKERFQDLLPINDIDYEPRNIKELHQLYDKQPSDNKIRPILASISKITENRIIYRLCDICKAKMERTSIECPVCQNNTYHHKFNCYLQIADSTASMNCVAFENISQLLRDKSADQLSLLSDEEMKSLIDSCSFGLYLFGIENKNHRYLIRSIQLVEDDAIRKETRKNIKMINEIIFPSD